MLYAEASHTSHSHYLRNGGSNVWVNCISTDPVKCGYCSKGNFFNEKVKKCVKCSNPYCLTTMEFKS